MSTTIDVKESPAAPRDHTVSGGGGLQLHVREWGRPDGPSVLLIHGWSGNHLSWRAAIDGDLTDEVRLIAVDLRGHGMSERPLDPAAYQDHRLWAADVAAVIDALQLDHPTLVGWSYGGFVIGDYLREYGDGAISAINLVGAAVTLNEQFDHIGPAFLDNAPQAAQNDLQTRIAALRRLWHSMTVQALPTEVLEDALCGGAFVPPQVLGALISRQIDSDDALAALTVPVLVTHGLQDQVVLPTMATHVLNVCPTARPSWYQDTGHIPFIEGRDRFCRELLEITRSRAG